MSPSPWCLCGVVSLFIIVHFFSFLDMAPLLFFFSLQLAWPTFDLVSQYFILMPLSVPDVAYTVVFSFILIDLFAAWVVLTRHIIYPISPLFSYYTLVIS
jgi:hypothetical protein